MNKFMILGASVLQVPAIEKALQMGLEVYVLDYNPDAVGLKLPGVHKEIISTIDISGVVECAKKYNIDGIMTLATDMPMRSVASVCTELGLTGIDTDTAIRATNKFEMRKALRSKGVPIPLYHITSSQQECLKAAEDIHKRGMKCIIKPVDSSGSRGISLLPNFDEDKILEAYNYSFQYSHCGRVLVEEFMEGPEVSVETLSIHGTCHVVQITDKLTTGAPYFVEMGHSQPSMLPEEMQREIVRIAQEANQAIGIQNGPSHTEIIVTADGPKIVELGARLGGDNIATHLVPLSTGVDLVESCIQMALGQIPKLDCTLNKAAAIRYFPTSAGKIKKIEGIEESKRVQGVKEVYVVHGVGSQLNGIFCSSDRMGFVIAQADSSSEAIRACEQALERIHVIVE